MMMPGRGSKFHFRSSEQFSTISIVLFAFSIFLIVGCVIAIAVITFNYQELRDCPDCPKNKFKLKNLTFNTHGIKTTIPPNDIIQKIETEMPTTSSVMESTTIPITRATITFSFQSTINVTSSKPPTTVYRKSEDICLDEECIKIAAHYNENMNSKVDPCNNFYEFACDRFGTGKVMPKNEQKLTVLYEMKAQLNKDYHSLLESLTINSTTTKPLKLLKQYYDSCMDDGAQDSLDQMPLTSLISSIGGWPLMVNAKFDENLFKWESLEYQLHMLGLTGLFSLSVVPDIEDNSRYSIMFRSPQLLLEHKHLYAAPYSNNAHLQHYKVYMVELMELLDADPEAIESSLQLVIEFEQKLAKISTCNEGTTNCQKHHKITFGDFRRKIDKIEWDVFFNANIKNTLQPLTENTIIDVMDMEYFENVQQLLTTSNYEVIQNYLMWKVLHSFDTYLPQKYREPHETFNEKVYGFSVVPLWEECVNEVKKRLPLILSVEYTKRNVKQAKYDHVTDLLTNLKSSLRQTIANNDWMSSDTKLKALLKLERIGVKIGIPKQYLTHESLILQQFQHITLFPSNYFDNTISLVKSFYQSNLQKIHHPTNNFIEFVNQLTDVDAFYHFSGNQIIFSSGILRFPFYGVDAPEFVNYGSLGSGIGHELIHGYDDAGANFDKDGNLNYWWDKYTQSNYNSKKECFVSQYSSIIEKITQKPLNGEQTAIENIADNGGLRLAFEAYQKRISHINFDKSFPTFANTTVNQLFFIAYANTWCEVTRKESINYILDTDSHSLGEYRVNVPLQNYPQFATIFKCPVGSPMNPYKKCQIW